MNSASVLHSQGIASHTGIHSTDIETLDILNVLGPMSASQLGDLTGLTSGAVTRLVDRLERLGLASRTPDPDDRRKVIIVPDEVAGAERLLPLFLPLLDGAERLLSGYTEAELTLIVRFMQEFTDLVRRDTARLESMQEA